MKKIIKVAAVALSAAVAVAGVILYKNKNR